MNLFDNAEIAVPCPQCGHENKETLGRLKHDPQIVCGGCAEVITIDSSELKESLQAVDKKLADFRRNLSRLGKR
ncbi:phage terminase large subunit family protein [Ancylobacter polymorphus]|uniref:Phage terminase large subunit family protein n=1 Tax=Ancylobacter polymorphus TaxID=223390 RepID=A0A9E6ZZW0_9HYPH|nr:phage terminase large subunit family protein [Ancylobacter polymorphus]UOK72992.1 phage terminase large subunit family protein [Ancylobacter polymorphus]